MGYHTRKIARGVYKEFSKVEEEWAELLDAREQGARILEICELADLYGAIKGYVEARFGLTMDDVATMSRMTSEAFVEGSRATVTPSVGDNPDEATEPTEALRRYLTSRGVNHT